MPLLKLEYRHKHLIAYIKKNKLKLYSAMICMLLVAACAPATAQLIRPVIDKIFIDNDTFLLKLIPLAVIVLFFLKGAGTFGYEYLMEAVGQRIIRHLRNDLFDRIIDLPLSFFHKERTGVLMSRITNDVNVIKAMVSTAVTGALKDSSTILWSQKNDRNTT